MWPPCESGLSVVQRKAPAGPDPVDKRGAPTDAESVGARDCRGGERMGLGAGSICSSQVM